jgi:hypothetical protein
MFVQSQCRLASALVTVSPYYIWLTMSGTVCRCPCAIQSSLERVSSSQTVTTFRYYRAKLNEHRVTRLSSLLRDIERVLSEQVLTDWQTKALAYHLEECHNVLITLGEVVDKNYLMNPSNSHGFRDKSRRAWKRLTWVPDDIQELRSRVTLNIVLLNAFNGSLARWLSKVPNKILLAG